MSKLLNSVSIVIAGTILSRCSGFTRDLAIMSKLGITLLNDAFIISLRITAVVRSIIIEGVLNTLFVPKFIKALKYRGEKEARKIATQLHVVLFKISASFTLLTISLMPYIIWYIAPSFRNNPNLYSLTVLSGRVSCLYLIFTSFSTFYANILHSQNNSIPLVILPIIVNVITIILIEYLDCFKTSTHTLLIITTVSGIAQILLMLFFLSYYNFSFLKHRWCNVKVKRLLKSFIPITCSSLVFYLNSWITIIVLAFFSGGASYTYHIERFVQFPLSLIYNVLNLILLPFLIRSSHGRAVFIYNKIASIIVFIIVPTMFVLIYYAYEISFFMLKRGSFTIFDTKRIVRVLAYLTLNFPANVMIRLLQVCFYSTSNTSIPIASTMFSLGVNAIFIFCTVTKFESLSITISNVASNWLHFFLLSCLACKYLDLTLFPKVYVYLIQFLAAFAFSFFLCKRIVRLNEDIFIFFVLKILAMVSMYLTLCFVLS